MPTAYLLTPYLIEPNGAGLARVPELSQQFDAQIIGDDGAYVCAEIHGNQALCHVRASAATLADLALAFPVVANPALAWKPTYGTHQLVAGNIVPHPSRRHPAKPVEVLTDEVLSDVELDGVKAILDGYVLEMQQGGKVILPRNLRGTVKNELLIRAARAGFGLNKLSTGTFPTQGVLDNFDRANAQTLGANWANNLIYLPSGTAVDQAIVSNAVGQATSQSAVGLSFTTNNYGPDSEAYHTITTQVSGDSHAVLCRIVQPGTTTYDGYAFHYNPSTTTWRVYRADNGALTQIAGVTNAFTNGDKLGGDVIGSQCTVYQFSGGAWNTRATASDGTYSAAGLIGMYCPGTSSAYALDDFGGGTVAVLGAAVKASFTRFPKQKLANGLQGRSR